MENNVPVGALIHQTANYIDTFIDSYLNNSKDVFLTAMEGMTMRTIYHKDGPLFAKDIMKSTHVSKATTSQTLNSLVRKGLIIMQTKENDKRSKIIYLTDKGKETIIKFDEAFAKITEATEKDFTVEEREILVRLLEKIRNNVTIK